jgi:hypothetical protein
MPLVRHSWIHLLLFLLSRRVVIKNGSCRYASIFLEPKRAAFASCVGFALLWLSGAASCCLLAACWLVHVFGVCCAYAQKGRSRVTTSRESQCVRVCVY